MERMYVGKKLKIFDFAMIVILSDINRIETSKILGPQVIWEKVVGSQNDVPILRGN